MVLMVQMVQIDDHNKLAYTDGVSIFWLWCFTGDTAETYEDTCDTDDVDGTNGTNGTNSTDI